MITFTAYGTPAPKGSARAMLVGGRPRVIASGSSANQRELASWDTALRLAAWEAIGPSSSSPPFVDQALLVVLTFHLARPRGHFGTGRNAGQLRASAPRYPNAMKLDGDKLARATLDALTGIVYDDDGRIVELLVRKRYATPGDEGATILVDVMA